MLICILSVCMEIPEADLASPALHSIPLAVPPHSRRLLHSRHRRTGPLMLKTQYDQLGCSASVPDLGLSLALAVGCPLSGCTAARELRLCCFVRYLCLWSQRQSEVALWVHCHQLIGPHLSRSLVDWLRNCPCPFQLGLRCVMALSFHPS